MKFNSDATLCNKVAEIAIKEENVDLDFNPQNDWQHFSKTLVMKVKQCNDVYEMETKKEMDEACVDSNFCSQNEEQFFSEVPAVTVNSCNKGSELESKIEIKEELQWLETTSAEAPSFDDVTQDWVDESFPSTESIRFYTEEASRDKTGLFSDENCRNNLEYTMRKVSPKCERARKYTSKEITFPEISTV